jgi:ketosteroid isomerase-like protein
VTRETIDLLRTAYQALNADDLDTVLASIDSDFVLDRPILLPGAPSYEGHAGFTEAWRKFRSSWEELRYEPGAFMISGDNVLVDVKIQGCAKGSGVDTEVTVFHVWTMRDDKAVRWRSFIDRDEALAEVDREPV